MARQAKVKYGFMTALEELMDIALQPTATPWEEQITQEEWLKKHMSKAAFNAALDRAHAGIGVGCDGFNAWLLRITPKDMKDRYYELLCHMARSKVFPEEFKDWRCVLAMKKNEDPRLVHRRRDLWLTPHAQKIIARMIGEEYERVADKTVPGSQGGFTRFRDGPGMHVPLVAQKAICRDYTTGMYRAYVDLGQFFPTAVREVQWRVERRMGVAPAATAVMQALHEGAKGMARTAFGATNPWELELGLGQGCVNAAKRAKLQVALIQGAVSAMCEGFDCGALQMEEEGGAIPQMFFADDGAFMSNTLWGQQTMIDTCWWVTRVMGLRMIVKSDKSKTAWQARC